MPKKTTISLPFAKDWKRRLDLEFVDAPVLLSQKRVVGRRLLKPLIDLASYSCGAVIGRVEMEFHLSRETKSRYVQTVLKPISSGVPDIKPIGSKPGGTTNTFWMTFKDPHLWELAEVSNVLSKSFGLASSPKNRAIAVSVDFDPRAASADACRKMVATLTRHLSPARDVLARSNDQPWFAWGEGGANRSPVWGARISYENWDPVFNVDTDRTIPPDAAFCLGEDGAAVTWRVMDNYSDRQNTLTGTSGILPEKDRRARVEVTLRGSELRKNGIETLEELVTVNLVKFQGQYFQFSLPTFISLSALGPTDPFMERRRMQRFLNIGVAGLAALDRERQRRLIQIRTDMIKLRQKVDKKVRRGQGKTGTMVAYDDLDEMVRGALRKLQLKEKRLLGASEHELGRLETLF